MPVIIIPSPVMSHHTPPPDFRTSCFPRQQHVRFIILELKFYGAISPVIRMLESYCGERQTLPLFIFLPF